MPAPTLNIGFNQGPKTLVASTGKYGILSPQALFSSVVAVGVQVASGKLVSTADGTQVFLIGQGVSGLEFGPKFQSNGWAGISNVLPSQWAAGILSWFNTLSTGGKPYGKINCIRLALNSACWLGTTGIDYNNNSGAAAAHYGTAGTDANGRTLYTAGSSGGGPGTGVGHEAPGDFTAYRNAVATTLSNIFAGFSILGYPGYVILDHHWNAPVWTATGQALMPVGQSASLSIGDLPFFQSLAATYGSDPRILIELYNETFGSNSSVNFSTSENAWIGNGNGNPVAVPFPTTSTTPNTPNAGWNYLMSSSGGTVGNVAVMGAGGTVGSPNTCQLMSFQQASNAHRAAGGKNVIIVGCTINTGWLPAWSVNGGSQTYVDMLTVGGFKQSAASFHSYAGGSTLTNMTNLVNAGFPLIVTEYGQVTSGGTGVVAGLSYTWMKANISGYMPFAWANYDNVTNIYNQGSFSISAENPFSNVNVPRSGTAGSQIPTGSN